MIEDNVVDVPRDWGIELYSDMNSIVRHNTVVHHPKSYSEFNTGTGQIDIDRKSQDPAGTGTHVYYNLASVDFANGSTGTQDHNVSSEQAKYVGPLTSWAGFRLSTDSPVGVKAASDGLDDGARISTAPQPTPTPTLTPPTDTATQAIWTAPGGATVGTPVTARWDGLEGRCAALVHLELREPGRVDDLGDPDRL